MLQTVTLALWAANGFRRGARCVHGLTSADPLEEDQVSRDLDISWLANLLGYRC